MVTESTNVKSFTRGRTLQIWGAPTNKRNGIYKCRLGSQTRKEQFDGTLETYD